MGSGAQAPAPRCRRLAAASCGPRGLSAAQLGSVSFATNASGSATSQQDYDAWGAVRSGGISATSLNYTGQRLDSTGLLDYHARLYDPTLARFVSADTIAPKHEDPQTRNRYSYVLNNPLRFTDPTGHCAEDDGDDPAACAVATAELHILGLEVSNADKVWRLNELKLVLEGAYMLQKAAGWSNVDFKNAMTQGGTYTIFLYRTSRTDIQDTSSGATSPPTPANTINVQFADLAFTNRTEALLTSIHELVHVWDAASGYILSNNMAAATGSYYGCTNYWDCYSHGDPHYVPKGSPASDAAYKNHREDWAEAVTASVFTERPEFNDWWGNPRMDSTRSKYVQRTFQYYQQ